MNAQPSGAASRPKAGSTRQALTAAVVRLLARRTPYLESEMLGLAELVGPGSVCVDVGAAAGLYTAMLAQLTGPSGQVLSIEPLSFAHPMWARVLGVKTAGNVRWYSLAVSSEPGHGVMSVPKNRGGGKVTGRSFLDSNTTGQGSNAEFAGQIEVDIEIQTLDGLCASAGLTRLDFIKIDVEGAELRVLEGGQRTIETYRPALLVEIEDRHAERFRSSAADVVGWLTGRGYAMYKWQDGWREAGAITAETRNYLFRPTAGPVEPAGTSAARLSAAGQSVPQPATEPQPAGEPEAAGEPKPVSDAAPVSAHEPAHLT
jgi:FkbM family methyltransferase